MSIDRRQNTQPAWDWHGAAHDETWEAAPSPETDVYDASWDVVESNQPSAVGQSASIADPIIGALDTLRRHLGPDNPRTPPQRLSYPSEQPSSRHSRNAEDDLVTYQYIDETSSQNGQPGAGELLSPLDPYEGAPWNADDDYNSAAGTPYGNSPADYDAMLADSANDWQHFFASQGVQQPAQEIPQTVQPSAYPGRGGAMPSEAPGSGDEEWQAMLREQSQMQPAQQPTYRAANTPHQGAMHPAPSDTPNYFDRSAVMAGDRRIRNHPADRGQQMGHANRTSPQQAVFEQTNIAGSGQNQFRGGTQQMQRTAAPAAQQNFAGNGFSQPRNAYQQQQHPQQQIGDPRHTAYRQDQPEPSIVSGAHQTWPDEHSSEPTLERYSRPTSRREPSFAQVPQSQSQRVQEPRWQSAADSPLSVSPRAIAATTSTMGGRPQGRRDRDNEASRSVEAYFGRRPLWIILSIIAGLAFIFHPWRYNELNGFELSLDAPFFAGVALILLGMFGRFFLMREPDELLVDEWTAAALENLESDALDKMGIRDDELLVRPIVFAGFPDLNKAKGAYRTSRHGNDHVLRFTPRALTILAFREHDILAYEGAVDITTGTCVYEKVSEFFYRDITSIGVSRQTVQRDLNSYSQVARLFMPWRKRFIDRWSGVISGQTRRAVNHKDSRDIFYIGLSSGEAIVSVMRDGRFSGDQSQDELPVHMPAELVPNIRALVHAKKNEQLAQPQLG